MSVVQDGTPGILNAGIAEASVYNAGCADARIQIDGNAESGVFMLIREGAYPAYTGDTEITPGEEGITLATQNKTVLSDIVINPIPSNYGRITWNGSTLRVD